MKKSEAPLVLGRAHRISGVAQQNAMRTGGLFRNSLLIIFSCVYFLLSSQPKIKFIKTRQNFGFEKKGKEIIIPFIFLNVGTQPLNITDGTASCSCTTVNWPQKPVLPGKQDTLFVIFDSANAIGRQDRTVEIFSNDPEAPVKIRFKGVILSK